MKRLFCAVLLYFPRSVELKKMRVLLLSRILGAGVSPLLIAAVYPPTTTELEAGSNLQHTGNYHDRTVHDSVPQGKHDIQWIRLNINPQPQFLSLSRHSQHASGMPTVPAD